MEDSYKWEALKTIAQKHILPGFKSSVFVIKERELQVVVQGETNAQYYGSFCISFFPGNSSILIFHNVSVHYAIQGKGLGQRLHNIRLDIAKELEARLVMCTVSITNEKQAHILKKAGWMHSNSYDEHWQVWVKKIQQ